MILDKLAYLREKFSLRKKKKPNRFKKKMFLVEMPPKGR